MQRHCGCVLIATAIVAACGPAQPVLDQGDPIAALFSGQAEWIDMSYAYDEGTIFWPTARVFELEIVEAGTSDAGYYYAANRFCTAEHGGTHLDAPIHFGEGRNSKCLRQSDTAVTSSFRLNASRSGSPMTV